MSEVPANREVEQIAARRRALIVLAFMPLFFSSNIIFGRSAILLGAEPFTLAFLRWFFTALILLPFVWASWRTSRSIIWRISPMLALMGFLGMWICGALVYYALKYTSATNGTLIYTSSPVIIIVIEWLFRGRRIALRELLGIAVAVVGVAAIVTKGQLQTLVSLDFNSGDLIFVGTAISWAIYSVLLRDKRLSGFPTLPLFALIAGSGALLLLPFALAETILLDTFPVGLELWANIAGIVVLASLVAFSSFQYGVSIVGSSIAGIFLYFLPIYGVGLAVILLGEVLQPFHFWGILLVIGGVVLATFPTGQKKAV